ncbi:hypothetical protein COY23_00455 [bacterium (Candidatus Torokbacteria) CG_4_10_14_0_2_um_filter_35_8]|nr:MAG: hypothetical protein COY23_00455 [bacterium (Candidatus Torokbacteria) CG_4_10_14_0_2_um_filter_35_8]
MGLLSGLSDLNQLRKQANQMKQELAQERLEGSALSDQVRIVMDGNQDVQEVNIAEELLSPDKKETLEDGIKECLSQCHAQFQQMMMKRMQNGSLM